MKIADFGLARNIRDLEYYRKTTDVSLLYTFPLSDDDGGGGGGVGDSLRSKKQKAMTTVKALFELVLEPYSRPILLIITT